jgi:hypothetical protein
MEGVYVHDTEDIDLGYDLNEDHAARPDLELSDELRVVSTQ